MTNPDATASAAEAAQRVTKGQSFDVTIERMAHGGVGIGAAPDGRVCFVAGGFPGDLSLIHI